MTYLYIKPPMNEYRTVPLHLFQTWHSKQLPPLMYQCVTQLKQANPEFTHHLYDDDMCRTFIQDHFPGVLHTYDTLIPGAYKADLWRYCILYVYGGIYLDIKYKCVHPFKLIELTTKEQYVCDREYAGVEGVYQALMVCYPKNPILYTCIQKIVSYVNQNDYGKSCLFMGPHLVGSFFTKVELHNFPMKFTGTGILRQGKLILTTYPEYRRELKQFSTKKHYSELWLQRSIYSYRKLLPFSVEVIPVEATSACISKGTVYTLNKGKNYSMTYGTEWGIPVLLPHSYTQMYLYVYNDLLYFVGLKNNRVWSGVYPNGSMIRPTFHTSSVPEILWCMGTWNHELCIVYTWYPLQIGRIEKNTLTIHTVHYHVPPFFKELYTAYSSVPWKDQQWVVLVKPTCYVWNEKPSIKHEYIFVILNEMMEVVKYSEFFIVEGMISHLSIDERGIEMCTTLGKCSIAMYSWNTLHELTWTYNESLCS